MDGVTASNKMWVCRNEATAGHYSLRDQFAHVSVDKADVAQHEHVRDDVTSVYGINH
jgi:hypothetical protein